jgi:hypothetical protein
MDNKKKSGVEHGDVVNLRGALEIAVHDVYTGEVVEKRSIKNTVVRIGRRWVLHKLQSVSPPAEEIEYLAIGTDTTAPATGDLTLGSENNRKAIGTFETSNLTSNPPSWEAQASWATNEGNTTLGEVGLFNSSSNGTLVARATFATLNKTTSNTLSISYTISN